MSLNRFIKNKNKNKCILTVIIFFCIIKMNNEKNRKNVDPLIWGKHWWKVLESLYHSYPQESNIELWNDDDKSFLTSLKTFLLLLKDLLPCEMCRIHYNEYIIQNPIEKIILSKETYWEWLYTLKNKIHPLHISSSDLLKRSNEYFYQREIHQQQLNIQHYMRSKTFSKMR
jgi:hypothetical protein